MAINAFCCVLYLAVFVAEACKVARSVFYMRYGSMCFLRVVFVGVFAFCCLKYVVAIQL